MSARGEVAVGLVTQRHDDRLVHYVSARIPWWVVRLADAASMRGALFAAIDHAQIRLRAGDVDGARRWCHAAHAVARAVAGGVVHEPGRCLCGHVLDRWSDAACRHCRRLAAEGGSERTVRT